MLAFEVALLAACCCLPLAIAANLSFFPCDSHTAGNHRILVNCQHRDLWRVPRVMSLSVVSLNLDENRVQRLRNKDLTGVPNLRVFTMKWNCLPERLKALRLPSCNVTIDADTFVNLKNLSVLHLAGNSLTSIPLLPEHLEVLGLEYNHLFHLDYTLGTPFLKQLLLAKNCYYANPCHKAFYITPQVFQDLPELLNLTLDYNNMTSVPTQLPSSLESLDLKENKITEIGEDAFANLTRLRHLNLGWNCQQCDRAAQPCFPCPNSFLKLHPRTFTKQAHTLTYLSLRGNSLRSLPQNLFTPLYKLNVLDLSENLLAYTIRNGTFYKEIKSVTTLNLLYNYEPRQIFTELVFSPYIREMTKLRTLHLSGIFFHRLSNRSLEPLVRLPRLEYLDLRMNFITSCNMSAFSQLRALRKVVLSENMLDFSECISARQTGYRVKSLIRVDGEDHQESHQPQDNSYVRCQTDSNLRAGTGGEDCRFVFTIWEFRKILCNKKLFFDLSQNNIPFLNASTFTGMEEAVCLDLAFNYISQTLNGQQFIQLHNLVYLNMAYNRIDLYFEEAFHELKNTLRALDLSNNEFHFLMNGMGHKLTFLANMTSLEALSLVNNHIGQRISNRLTSASLKYLFFSGNRLDIMWDTRGDQYISFFQDLTNLTHLDISHNRLRSFSPKAFVHLPRSLQVLYVDSNFLNYFPWANISALEQLCYLNLSGNHFSNLPDEIIRFGSNLKHLDLSHNRISSLPEAFFSQAEALRVLMLNHNQLMLLELISLPPLLHNGAGLCLPSPPHSKSVCQLTLHANPFTCSCNTSWFAEFLRASPVYIPRLTTDVRCGFPESQRGVSVLVIDPRSCQEIFGGIAFIATSLLLVSVTAVPLLKHLFGWDLWYCLQIVRARYKGYSPLHNKRTTNTHHDAFVVFDTENEAVRDWIYNELVANLENKGGQNFRLCLEERDWVPGVSCIENLHNAVHNSRKTIFVLTNGNGCAPVNGVLREAFLLVQQRLLDEKVDVAVLVLLDPLFLKLRYLKMRRRLCKKSVLSWPWNPRAQPLFWNDLRIALASDNKRFYDRNVTESFLCHELL